MHSASHEVTMVAMRCAERYKISAHTQFLRQVCKRKTYHAKAVFSAPHTASVSSFCCRARWNIKGSMWGVCAMYMWYSPCRQNRQSCTAAECAESHALQYRSRMQAKEPCCNNDAAQCDATLIVTLFCACIAAALACAATHKCYLLELMYNFQHMLATAQLSMHLL